MPSGPLTGIRVVEIAGIGPAPLGCMVLADLGADVVRVDRPTGPGLSLVPYRQDTLTRSRRAVAVDLKADGGADVVRRLADRADVFVEAFRPGVAERLGIGPSDLMRRNPRLVYARMTGWGQDGPLAARAGHDIDYASVVGALGAIGEAGRKPVPPLNLLADFGGGSMFLVTGVLAALVERATSGRGQVVDVAMVDGVATLTAMVHSHLAAGIWRDERGVNLFDGGAPYYDTYECADGEYVAVGAIERQFFAELVRVLGVADRAPGQHDQQRWPELRELFAQTFRTKTRDEWAAVFDDVDACVAPVMGLTEAIDHPHVKARGSLVTIDGVTQPAPAPRFERTPGAVQGPPRNPGEDTAETLADWGFDPAEVDRLLELGVVAQPEEPNEVRMDPRDRIRALFDRVATTYDNVGVDYFRPIAQGLVEELQPQPGERVLDIGCGRGAALVPLAERVRPDGTVTGIDLSPGMLDACRAVLRDAGLEAELLVGDAMAADLPRETFDVAASSLVIFFLSDPAAALRAWHELIRPGGRLGISTFGDYSSHWKAVEEVFNPHIPPELRDPRTTGKRGPFATDDGVEELLRAAGYEEVRTTRVRLPVRFVDKEQWHDWSWSVGLRAVWEAIPDDERDAVRRRAYDALEQTRDADGRMGFDQDVRYTIGRRP